MVLSLEAKRQAQGKWEIYTDCGRERSGIDAIEWAIRGTQLGAGEIIVTSIDSEGTRKGFDTDLLKAISDAVDVPVIASGGFGQPSHLSEAYEAGADAIAFADALHYERFTVNDLRRIATEQSIPVREV